MDSEEDPRFSDPAAMSVMHLGSHVILKPPVKSSRGVPSAPETTPPQDAGDSRFVKLEAIVSGEYCPITPTSSNEVVVVSKSLGPYLPPRLSPLPLVSLLFSPPPPPPSNLDLVDLLQTTVLPRP